MSCIVDAFREEQQIRPLQTEAPSVHLLQPQEEKKWDKFVSACPEATFFHRAGWQAVIQRAFGHKTWFLYAESEGEIQGVLPLAEVKSHLFGHSLSSLPFCVYGGIAAISEPGREVLDRAAQALASRLRVDYLEYRNLKMRHSDWPTKDLYATFRKEISPEIEQNMREIPRKQRAMVRKGIKAGLESVVDEDIERFFSAYSASLHRLGTPVFSKKYFRILKEVFTDDCELMIIIKEGHTVSGVMSFYFRDEVSPYYGGGTSEARDLAGNDFMYWELMRRACERGYKIFDFGRSKHNTGSFDFKKNWGFEPQPLYYEYQLHRSEAMPDHNPLNPKYQLFIKAWRKLPISVANFVGPYIVKNLG
ncbi:FemAB-related protein, PEP-CTERM system-associated [Nitrosospira sp. Nsp11]|uniref:FemAB family XrtA/PEP-CTERM system-associated protein n=1 Tax=unclassified Nitrosospira TaxID=2609267 RepID=UPI00088CD8F3|nr:MULTISPECIES: FemAB family XrtA/PEP-CTERM system-associated protein [unclassified Nitrosospira]SDA18664.1 FemAB-related protein, PEP-CTERM system-associated [Nitrosospira sp. Nsp18]SHL78556.1 FemAB-related protein, PEP-CTERM system-associated [Nitrosospira sp. Nsp11]